MLVAVVAVLIVVVDALMTQTTGRPKSSTSASLGDGSPSAAAWVNPAALSAAMPMGDNAFASTPSCDCTTQHLVMTEFVNLDSDRALRDKPIEVPAGASIRGVEVVVHRALDVGAAIDETDVVLVRGGAVISANLAGKGVTKVARWPPIAEAKSFSYGGSTNLWGVASPLTPAIVNDASFGVAIRVRTAGSGVARVDYARLSVFYETNDFIPSPTRAPDAGPAVLDGGTGTNNNGVVGGQSSNNNGGIDPTANGDGINQGGDMSSPAGDNTGLIVGVVVGVLLCCLLVALLAFLLLKRNKRERENRGGDIHTESFAFDQSNLHSARSQRADTDASALPNVPDSSRRGTNVQSNYVSEPISSEQQHYGGIQPSAAAAATSGSYAASATSSANSGMGYGNSRPAAATMSSIETPTSSNYGTRPAAQTVSSNYGSGRAAPLQYNKAIDIHGHDQYNQRPAHQQFGK
jgi:hypothetical protein